MTARIIDGKRIAEEFRREVRAGTDALERGGMRRPGLAVVMVGDNRTTPRLDPMAIDRVAELLNEVACMHELNTIVVVTHDISAALEVADTIWLMGRERDAEGKIIPGASIQESYNLIERGLAWRNGITTTPEFLDLMQEIREVFPRL